MAAASPAATLECAGSSLQSTVALGIAVLVSALVPAMLLSSGDPVDFSIQGKERAAATGRFVSTFGIAFFLGCVVAVISWLANKPWAKHAILAFAATAVLMTAIAIASLPFLIVCALPLFLVLIAADIALVRIMYPRVLTSPQQRLPPNAT